MGGGGTGFGPAFSDCGRCRRPGSLVPSGHTEAHGAPNAHCPSCHPHGCRTSAPTSPLQLLVAPPQSLQTAPTPRPDLNKRCPNHTPLTPRHPSVQKSTSQSVVGILNEPFDMSSLPSPEQYPSFRSQAGLPPTPGLCSVTLIRNRLLRATSRGERVKGKTPQFIHHQRQFYLLTKQLPSPGQELRAGPATSQGPVLVTLRFTVLHSLQRFNPHNNPVR